LTESSNSFPVGILVALNDEYDTLLEVFPHNRRERRQGREYDILTVRVEGQPHEVVARLMSGMGLESATDEAGALLHSYSAPLLVLVGIAGALSRELRLGDVVVADQVDDYMDRGKLTSEGLELAGAVWQAPWRLVELVKRLKYSHRTRFEEWQSQVASELDLRQLNLGENDIRDKPSVYASPIASSPFVIGESGFSQWLTKRNRKLVAVEMEAGGVARVAHNRERPIEFLVVRGISDFADKRKDELDEMGSGALRKYAMLSASRFLEMLFTLPEFFYADRLAMEAAEDLERIADEYRTIRRDFESSRERSAQLSRRLGPARQRAALLTPSVYDPKSYLSPEMDEGKRAVAIAIVQALDSPDYFNEMIDLLKHPRTSRFEQTEILRYMEAIAYRLDHAQQERLSRTLKSLNFPATTDRGLFSRLIERRILGASAPSRD
jgi:nucleoside phosphorylase